MNTGGNKQQINNRGLCQVPAPYPVSRATRPLETVIQTRPSGRKPEPEGHSSAWRTGGAQRSSVAESPTVVSTRRVQTHSSWKEPGLGIFRRALGRPLSAGEGGRGRWQNNVKRNVPNTEMILSHKMTSVYGQRLERNIKSHLNGLLFRVLNFHEVPASSGRCWYCVCVYVWVQVG